MSTEEEDILDVSEETTFNESIESYETFAYQPITGTQLNTSGQIVIRVENQDAFFHPRKSWLQIEGKLVKTAASAVYTNADKVALTNNGLMYIFDNIKYELNGQEIESVYNPGTASTILGLLKYPNSFNKGPGLNQCWSIDTGDDTEATNEGFTTRQKYIVSKPAPKGSFRFAIDLDHIFGFCEDYTKIMYGFTHTLTLVRSSSDNNAIYRKNGVDPGKVVIDKIAWMLPHVIPKMEQRYKLYKTIQSDKELSIGFRMRQCINTAVPATPTFTWRLGTRASPEKPRYIIIGFQTAKNNNQEKNIATFDHCKITNIYVQLNRTRYPDLDFNSDFDKFHIDNVYKTLTDFRQRFYNMDHLISNTTIDPLLYGELYPLIALDVSKQSERLKQGVVDITVEMTFAANVPANTYAHALVISDRKLRFKSDGKKMNIIY